MTASSYLPEEAITDSALVRKDALEDFGKLVRIIGAEKLQIDPEWNYEAQGGGI